MKRSKATSARRLTAWIKQGAVVACTLADQQQKLTEHFLELVKTKQSTVVVSQSWSEIHKVNEQVRLGLKTQKLIGEAETTVTALERLDLTDAQKRDKRFYQPDSVLVFNRPVVGFKSRRRGKLHGITDKHLLIEADNRIRPVPFKFLDWIHGLPAKRTSLVQRRPAATQGQQPKPGRTQAGQRRTGHGERNSSRRTHRVEGWPGAGKKLPPVCAWLRGHVLRRAREDGGLRFVFGFGGRRGHERTTMVCHDFARSARRQNLHGGQNPASPERHPCGNRPLALDMTREFRPQAGDDLGARCDLRSQHSTFATQISRTASRNTAPAGRTDNRSPSKQIESVKPAEAVKQAIQKSQTVRRRIEIPPRQTNQPSRSMRI
jgi:hypothetical protein